jgi:hypothetical protein
MTFRGTPASSASYYFELSSLPPKPAYLEAIQRILEERGVEFVDGERPSARLKL